MVNIQTIYLTEAEDIKKRWQEYWSELPFLSPVDLPDPGIKPMSPVLAGGLFITEPPGKPEVFIYCLLKNTQTTTQFTHLTC